MNRLVRIVSLTMLTLALAACSPGPQSASGFRLPDGNAETGKQVFIEMQCHACHTVKGVALPTAQETGKAQFVLGGEVTRVKTYGNLVTSVINPSHKLAPGFPRNEQTTTEGSPMRIYNDVMTVQQLVDLVAFLQSTYEVVAPEHNYHSYPM